MKRDMNNENESEQPDTIYSIIEKANIYQRQNTYTYVREIQPKDKLYNWNGFIIKVHYDCIIFFDTKDQREFPIPLTSIVKLEPSKRNDEYDARKIFKSFMETQQ